MLACSVGVVCIGLVYQGSPANPSDPNQEKNGTTLFLCTYLPVQNDGVPIPKKDSANGVCRKAESE